MENGMLDRKCYLTSRVLSSYSPAVFFFKPFFLDSLLPLPIILVAVLRLVLIYRSTLHCFSHPGTHYRALHLSIHHSQPHVLLVSTHTVHHLSCHFHLSDNHQHHLSPHFHSAHHCSPPLFLASYQFSRPKICGDLWIVECERGSSWPCYKNPQSAPREVQKRCHSYRTQRAVHQQCRCY